MYIHETTIRLHDTDAAGVIFFAQQLTLAHNAFEHFLDSVGLGLGYLLEHADYRIPIVHAESDYRAPVRVGDRLKIHVTLERSGNTSFTLSYRFVNESGTETGRVRTVQVAVNRSTWTKRELPAELRAALDKLAETGVRNSL